MVLNIVSAFLADYGWYLVLLSAIFAYIYKKFSPQLEHYIKQKEEVAYTAKYHKNPDLFASRISEQQSYIQRLQDEYEKEAELYMQKQQEKAELKKLEALSKYEDSSGSGKRLGNSSTKPEYNPLMGHASKSYKPPKKTCGGGGCGR